MARYRAGTEARRNTVLRSWHVHSMLHVGATSRVKRSSDRSRVSRSGLLALWFYMIYRVLNTQQRGSYCVVSRALYGAAGAAYRNITELLHSVLTVFDYYWSLTG